jgi:hypothetical protein
MHASDYSAKERLDWHQLVDERGAVYYRNSKTEREQDSMPVCGVTNDPDPDANLAGFSTAEAISLESDDEVDLFEAVLDSAGK